MEKDQYLTRSKARRGDLIAVTGEIGSAAFALKHEGKDLDSCPYTPPHPHIEIVQQIVSFAHACIDISDGLLVDLGHICTQSKLGAKIVLEQIPVNKLIKTSSPNWSDYVLAGGDDYQMCFTFAVEDLNKLPAHCSVIGQMGCGDTVKVYVNNQQIKLKHQGFIHFNSVD
ncbi:MAG: hypothetical protein JKY19_01205 [Alcanivoracaceae bacterium]|nr:hypothetical protein [Alcanivoracaceae bacterium]